MANPKPADRVISPHTLVYTGFRWHVRAYCHKRKAFRDFLLSRIDACSGVESKSAPSIDEDSLWQETVTLMLVPNARLNEDQKKLVEKDFGMTKGRLKVTVRKALAHYTLQRYQAAITEKDERDVQQFPMQLDELGRKELSTNFFKS